MKKFLSFLFAMFLGSGAVSAQMPMDAGNKICPVGGEAVAGDSFVEYEGKKYGLCCPACAEEFYKDPQKYLDAMHEKEAAAAGEAEDHAGHMH